MTKMTVKVHVDSSLPSLCRFPLLEVSISMEDMEQAAEYTRGHPCYGEPISPAFPDVIEFGRLVRTFGLRRGEFDAKCGLNKVSVFMTVDMIYLHADTMQTCICSLSISFTTW